MSNDRNLIIILAFVFINSCSTSLGSDRPAYEVFIGELQFSGEFRLIPLAESAPSGNVCMSGAFPLRKHLRYKRQYHGKVVRIEGRKVPYSSLTEEVGTERGWRGSQIPNYCGGEDVILGESAGIISDP